MAQRRHHYERAFEAYLRQRRIPYVAVDEAKKALLPENASLRVRADESAESTSLKSFDFVLYGDSGNFLIDIKGRKVLRRRAAREADDLGGTLLMTAPPAGRLETWVTEDDISSLRVWANLFGEGFEAAFVFVYWCDEQPPDGLFQEVMDYQGRWYALRAIKLEAYAGAMRVRSPRWRTVDLSRRDFDRLSQPFVHGWAQAGKVASTRV